MPGGGANSSGSAVSPRARQRSSRGHSRRPSAAVADIKVVDLVLAGSFESGCSMGFTILGEPRTQARARFVPTTSPSRRCVVYDPCQASKARVKELLKAALVELGVEGFPCVPQDTKLEVCATFMVAQTSKDVDNLLKFILDALEGIIFPNDRQVYKVVGEKMDAGGQPGYSSIHIKQR